MLVHVLSRMSRAFSVPNQTSPGLSTLLTKSWPPKYRFPRFPKHFDKYFGPVHFPLIRMYLLPLPHLIHRYLLASVHNCVRCFVSSFFLSTKNPLFFWLRLEFSTIIPFFQIWIHKSASQALGSMHFLSPLHGPSMIPVLSTCTLMGSITFFEKAKECCQLRPLDGELDLKFCFC